MPKVIRKIKSNINHSSGGVKDGKHHSASATVTRASADTISRPNSIRGVINKCTPRTASLVLLPSLAVLAMFMALSVVTPGNAYAALDDVLSNEPSSYGTSTASSTTFSIEDEKSIGITLSSENIILDISPTSSGVFNSTSMTVDVSTNNPTGYTLTMTADKTDLSRTSAINGFTPTIPTIPTGDTYTENTFQNGYWGYKIGTNTNYLPMTTDAIPINTTEAAANSSISTITFASKLDNSIPSGTYSGVTLSFVATTNLVPVYMQNISTAELAELMPNVGNNTVLRDSRDEKDYTVAKLADGNYWMLDNLALDLTTVPLDKLKGNTNATDTSLGYLKDGGGASPYTLTAVSSTWSKAYTDARINTAAIDTIPSNSSYGAGNHKVGVYYNYCAASAGSYCYDEEGTSEDASQDVCPSGWHMPTGDTTNGSYYYLFHTGYSSNSTMSDVGSLQYNLSTPLSGFSHSEPQGNQGSNGTFWSSTRYDGARMRFLSVNTSVVSPRDKDDRIYGFSVRCIFNS